MTRVNLPEEWGYWLGGGLLLGLVIGDARALLCSLAPLVLVLSPSATGSGQAEVNELVVGAYVPGAFVSVLLGIGMRLILRRATFGSRTARD